MILKELHKDIERYLLEDCYCPHEVYSIDGFGYMLVYEDAECELLFEGTYKGDSVFLVATYAQSHSVEKIPILLSIWHDDDSVSGMERYKLTEHNIREIKSVLNGEKTSICLSEMEELAEQTYKILSIADAILIG